MAFGVARGTNTEPITCDLRFTRLSPGNIVTASLLLHCDDQNGVMRKRLYELMGALGVSDQLQEIMDKVKQAIPLPAQS